MKKLKFESTFARETYGMLAEFQSSDLLLEATRKIYASGFRKMDGYSPYPVENLAEELGVTQTSVPLLALSGGALLGIFAFAFQWYADVISYPINVAGKPDFSWQAFIPITFELTILGAALSAAFGMLLLNRLPELWHPLFQAPEFANASRDRFFLCIFKADELYDAAKIKDLLEPFRPTQIREVVVDAD